MQVSWHVQVSYTFCCDFISLLMKSAGSSDEFGPTEVVVQGLKKVSDINIYLSSVEIKQFHAYVVSFNSPRHFITRTWLRYVRVFAIANPSIFRLSSVTFVRPTDRVEAFGKISSPLAIVWHSCTILLRLSQGNPSIGSVKHKKGSKNRATLGPSKVYLTNGTRYGLGYN